jgi:hypothetical protein
MSVRCWTVLLALTAIAASAHAQIGIYGKFDATNLSTGNGDQYETPGWYYGGAAGVYDDFVHLGPIGLGLDLRGNLLAGNQQKYRSALVGLRLAVNPPILPIRPYIQGSVGLGSTSHSGLEGAGTNYSNKFQYLVLGGVDYTIFPHLDWRVAELGYGRMSGISSSGSAPTVNLFTIGSGLVVRFP